MASDELIFFQRHGYLGPFPLLDGEKARAMGQRMREFLETHPDCYSGITGRDRHFDMPEILELACHPRLTESVATVLGQDLLLWRSAFFDKPPGGPEIVWHVGGAFPGYLNRPSLAPDRNITVWLGLDDANEENGCVEVIPGSHHWDLKYEAVEGDGIFGRNFRIRDLDPSGAIPMRVKAGEFFLFHNHLIHGSGPNLSQRNRTGLAFRITTTATRIYPGLRVDGQGAELDQWRAILIRGEDRYGLNKAETPEGAPAAQPLDRLRGRCRSFLANFWSRLRSWLDWKIRSLKSRPG